MTATIASPRAPGADTALTLRRARPGDAPALDRLAALDSARAPSGAVLVAEVGGELWAAVSADDFHAVADPFRPTGELVFLLLEHARRQRGGQAKGLAAMKKMATRTRTPRKTSAAM